MKCRLWVLSVVLFATLTFQQSHADLPSPCMLATTLIPDRNSISLTSAVPTPTPRPRPTILERPKPIAPIGCVRPFTYRGDTYSVDSPQAADAGNLKYFTRGTPAAQTYLSEYQYNREKIRVSAFSSTTGIFLALFSAGIGRWLAPRNPSPVTNVSLFLGGAIAVEGISYSAMLLRQNEKLLNEAVEAHNQANPKDPVELQFSTGWSF